MTRNHDVQFSTSGQELVVLQTTLFMFGKFVDGQTHSRTS